MKVIIEKVNKPDNWDAEVEHFNGGLFMTSCWIESIATENTRPLYLKFISDNKTVAIAGGVETPVRKEPEKQLLFYSGIASLIDDPGMNSKFKSALYSYAKEYKYRRITLHSYDHHAHINSKDSHFTKIERTEYVFRLDEDKEQLINSFDRDLRRRVRKARKEGVVFKNSSDPGLTRVLLNCMDQTFQIRQSKGYGRYNYFYLPLFKRSDIIKLVSSGYASFYYAEKKEETLSIQLVFSHNNRAYGILMGTSHNGYRYAASSFLFYEIVNSLKEQGYRYYNLGGVQPDRSQQGLRKFKDTLGAGTLGTAIEMTGFIGLPLSFLNPLLKMKQFLLEIHFLPWRFKKPVKRILNLFLDGRDMI